MLKLQPATHALRGAHSRAVVHPCTGAVEVAALDEADKMLSLGFQPQLDRLRALLPCKRNAATLAGDAPPPRTRVQVSYAQ